MERVVCASEVAGEFKKTVTKWSMDAQTDV